jgi:hypothetical protein
MPVIDADTHVTECDATFGYVQESEQRFVPTKGVMGSDFVHHDHAEELDFIGAMNARVSRGFAFRFVES